MKAAGYNTYYSGKFLNGFTSEAATRQGCPKGWTSMDALIKGDSGASEELYYKGTPTFLRRCAEVEVFPDGFEEAIIRDKALAYVDEAADAGKPFFLMVAPMAPHDSISGGSAAIPEVEVKYRHLYPGVQLPKNPNFGRNVPGQIGYYWPTDVRKELASITARYRARLQSLRTVDDTVAALVSRLACRGLLEDTVVVYTSDNGYKLGNHNIAQEKFTQYEEDVRVPLLLAGPGIPRGVLAGGELQASLPDLTATILWLAGASTGRINIDGAALPLTDLLQRYNRSSSSSTAGTKAGPLLPPDSDSSYYCAPAPPPDPPAPHAPPRPPRPPSPPTTVPSQDKLSPFPPQLSRPLPSPSLSPRPSPVARPPTSPRPASVPGTTTAPSQSGTPSPRRQRGLEAMPGALQRQQLQEQEQEEQSDGRQEQQPEPQVSSSSDADGASAGHEDAPLIMTSGSEVPGSSWPRPEGWTWHYDLWLEDHAAELGLEGWMEEMRSAHDRNSTGGAIASEQQRRQQKRQRPLPTLPPVDGPTLLAYSMQRVSTALDEAEVEALQRQRKAVEDEGQSEAEGVEVRGVARRSLQKGKKGANATDDSGSGGLVPASSLDGWSNMVLIESWLDGVFKGKSYRTLRACTTFLAFGPTVDGQAWTCYKYTVLCNPVKKQTSTLTNLELYDLGQDPAEVKDRSRPPLTATARRLMDRLDAVLTVMSYCEGALCRNPFLRIHPDMRITNLAQAMDPKYDTLYGGGFKKLTYKKCSIYYDPVNEAPDPYLAGYSGVFPSAS